MANNTEAGETLMELKDKYGCHEPKMDDVVSDLRPVQPTQVVHGNGTTHTYTYTFSGIAVDEIDTPLESRGRLYVDGGVGVWSAYPNAPNVYLTEDEVLAWIHDGRQKCERQAYYALSILDVHGLVGNWTKVID